MISADFYSTQTTQYTVEYTDSIPNLTYDDAETIAEAYYMGYINWDDVPTMTHMSKFNVVQGAEEAYVEFVDVTKTENLPWFFTGRYTTSASNAYGTYILNDSDNYVLPTVGAGGNYCFFNNLEIQRVSAYGGYMLYVFYNIINPVTTPPTYSMGGAYLLYTSTTISVEDFWKWVSGEITLHTSITIGAVQEDIEFTFEDFANGYCEKEHTNGTVQFYLVDYSTPYAARDVQPNDEWARWSNTCVGTLMHAEIDGDEKPYLTNTFGWHSGYSDERYIRIDNVQTLSHYAGGYSGHVMGGFNGRIPYTFFAYGSSDRYYVFGNMIVWKYTSSQTRIARIFTSSEIAKIYSGLFTRISTTGVNPAYGFSDIIAYPLFNDDNSPKWEYVTGLQSDIQSQLQPWQYTNITANTFTGDDIPEYEPPSPSDDTDSGGDDIRPYDWTNLRIGAANNFVTLYGMTAETVADFGQQMWANLADPAFWQMVGTVFTNDFSINPADMMKYFISLRYFPFDVADFAHSTATGIYVGRAATPIAPSIGVAYPIRVTNNVVQVDGGRLTIRRYYNDFRDFEPCTTVQIHVPFCGSVDVPASEVMGHEMDLTYKIDLQTGAMLAVLGVTSNTYYVIATLAGTCGATIPITANNNIEFLQRIATVGSGLIGGGVSGAVKGATVGGEVGAVVGAVAGTVGGGVGALAGLPPVTVHKQGNASGFANLGGVPYAYATVQRGRFERPANYGHTTGFACDFSATIGSLSGFTVCDNVDTSGLTCNADERDEIKRLLESGVYV